MSRLTILDPHEIKLFDKPPRFTAEQQQKYFALTVQLQPLLQRLRTPTNKVCLVLQWGYFRATGRFFMPKDFRVADIQYVSEQLDFTPASIDLNDYCQKPKISRDHEKIILKAMGFKAFNQTAKQLLLEQIQHLAEKSMLPRDMLYFLASHLHQQKIEIPAYHTFTEAITKSYNQVETHLLEIIDCALTQHNINQLDALITNNTSNEGVLSEWKSVNQSLRVKDIVQSILIFKTIKSYFYDYWPIMEKLNLPSATIEYYATWLKKARLSQIKQFPNRNKLYLHLMAFIQHQFYCRQDALIDILLKSVQRIKNKVIKKCLQQEQSTRKERLALLEQMVDEQALLESIFSQINAIVNSNEMTDQSKVDEIKVLLQQYYLDQQPASGQEKPLSKQQQLRRLLNDNNYYEWLERFSVKLHNRVARIVKAAPTDFLDSQQLKIVYDANHQLRLPLYKVFLFFNIASSIKSGHLNEGAHGVKQVRRPSHSCSTGCFIVVEALA